MPSGAQDSDLWQRTEAEHAAFATRFAGQLLLFGGVLSAVLTATLSVTAGTFSRDWFILMGACVIGIIWGIGFILARRPMPAPVLNATPAGAAVLITSAEAAIHSSSADAMILLSWPVLFAAYLLSRATAYFTLAVVAVCLTVVLTLGTGPSTDRFSTWLEIITSVTLTLIVIMRVREQNERLKETLAQQARTDPLTGLNNRRAFSEALEREYLRLRRTGKPLSLLAVDVDHFKQINDNYGHAAGDEALRQLGELLPRIVRAYDSVGRIGGEEFGVLMPDCNSIQAMGRANALRAAVYSESQMWGHQVTVSVGIATVPDSAGSVEELQIAADSALYRAKDAGRDRVFAAPTHVAKDR